MPISGLVLSLAPDAAPPRVAGDLDTDPRIDVGPAKGHRLPIVTETATSDEDRALWAWIRSREGVRHIDVVFIHFDDDHTVGTGGHLHPSGGHDAS